MANIKTLKDLTPGTVFDAGPIDVRVLDHMTNGTTLLIADKAVAWRPFSLEPMKTRPVEAPTPYPNDFSLSYLKDELNGPFLAAFDTAGGPIRSANIVTADWSLADHRGGFGYGNMKAKISLLPEALFLKYKALLALDDWWWLVTPYAGYARSARVVSTGGSLNSSYAYSGDNGVRPAFFAESGIILESDGGEADGAATGLYAVPTGIAWRGRDGSSSYEVRSDQKTNAVTADGHQSRMVIIAAGGKAHPVYSVTDGFIEIKGKKYPIRLPDGLYIIRKLTVNECKRLQTVPEWYHFSVSQTQAYKMLGNGWTVDVISHILSYCPGLTETPTEVFSMYDGMSCGRLALLKLGVNITNYYATEIDKYAIATTQENFPDTIQLGDAFQVREDDWTLQKGGVINE